MHKKMAAKLISYKRNKDENRYSTFSNVSLESRDSVHIKSTKPLTKKQQKKLMVDPQVHKSSKISKDSKSSKAKSNRSKSNMRFKSIFRCKSYRNVLRRLCCCSFKTNKKSKSKDEDVDKAFEDYKLEMRLKDLNGGPDSQRSTLKSERGTGHFWSWNDSWKSNSDHFLESLEFETVGSDRSWKRKMKQKSGKVRITAFKTTYEGLRKLAWK